MLKAFIIVLITILSLVLVAYLNAQRNQIKLGMDSEVAKRYTDMIFDTITHCVVATNQTYVDTLKKAGKFDGAAQKEAFNKTLQTVLSILTDDVKEYIKMTTGDVDSYLSAIIEAAVRQNK